MRKICLVAAAALLVALSSPALTAAKSAAYKPCSGGFNPDGAKGSFYSKIRAKKIKCGTARSITKAWVRYEAMTDGANPTGKVKIKGYKCSGKTTAGGALSVVCANGGKGVRFTGHP
jgi:hypothetical protein